MDGCGPHVHGYAARAGRIVTLRSTSAGVLDLYADDEEGGGRRRLTREGSAWQRALTGIACEQVSIPGPAGRSARRCSRRAARAARRCRSCSRSSAGRAASWGPEPWLPDWMLAAAGARVLMPDPRGSASYGRAWLEAIRGDWGGADAEDQLACADWAVGQGLADPRPAGRHRPLLRRLHDALADRPERPLPRRRGRQRRGQPDLRGRELRPGRAVDAAHRLGPPAGRLRAPLAAVAAGARRAHHDARC